MGHSMDLQVYTNNNRDMEDAVPSLNGMEMLINSLDSQMMRNCAPFIGQRAQFSRLKSSRITVSYPLRSGLSSRAVFDSVDREWN